MTAWKLCKCGLGINAYVSACNICGEDDTTEAVIHLDSGPRDFTTPLCGSEGVTTNEINNVTCERCEALHDEITERGMA